ncbi:hypothetical protein RP20_CCG015805 [Aedes albopictus]|nr:hypothetical protein RP20_CCG015805 [Aedes albopictus]
MHHALRPRRRPAALPIDVEIHRARLDRELGRDTITTTLGSKLDFERGRCVAYLYEKASSRDEMVNCETDDYSPLKSLDRRFAEKLIKIMEEFTRPHHRIGITRPVTRSLCPFYMLMEMEEVRRRRFDWHRSLSSRAA